MGIGFFAGFIVLELLLVAVSDVDPVMKAGGIAVSLLILGGYIYSVKAIIRFIRKAAGDSGLEEFQVDETGVSFRNLLPEKWRMGLYFISMAGMGNQTTALTKDSTFIPWDNIHYLRMKPDDLTILIGTVEGWAPFSQSDSPMILLSCTEDNYPLVEDYMRKYLSQTSHGSELL
jgi:hypothetical protein